MSFERPFHALTALLPKTFWLIAKFVFFFKKCITLVSGIIIYLTAFNEYPIDFCCVY